MNSDTKKVSKARIHVQTRLLIIFLQVNTENPDEKEVLKTFEQHAGKSLEADLLKSEMRFGLSQAGAQVTSTGGLA